MKIYIAEASNSIRFSVSMPHHSVGMFQRHDIRLLLYSPIPYSQALDHSVTNVVMNNMLFIGTTLSVTLCKIFI